MVYAFAVVWSWLIHGADTLNNATALDLPQAIVSAIKWLLSVFGMNNGYATALGGGAEVYSFNDFMELTTSYNANQFAMMLLGAITAMIISWGTMRLLIKVLTLKWR